MLRPFNSEIISTWDEIGHKELRPTVAERDRLGHFPIDIWNCLAKAGLFQLMQRDRLGLSEFHVRIGSALFGLAKGSLDLPFSASVAAHLAIASDLLHGFGTKEQIEKYLPEMREGRRIGAICNAEEGSGSDLRLMKASAAPGHAEDKVLVQAVKPCSTNLSIAGLAFVSCWGHTRDLRVFLLESGEFEQGPLQETFGSFRTGAVGFLRAEALVNATERELPQGLAALRQCFHTERYYLGVLVAGVLAGLENATSQRLLARETTAQRQYLQEKLVTLRAARVKIEAILQLIFLQSEGGTDWEKASVELCVLKIFLNTEAFRAAQSAFESIGFEAVLQRDDSQRIARDIQALSYFGGTTELQKIQAFQELAKAETARVGVRRAA